MSKCFPAGVSIGFQLTDILVNETASVVHVCAAIKCDCIRRDVEVNLFTQDGTATGMMWNTIIFCSSCTM